jgi:hypothetical protein
LLLKAAREFMAGKAPTQAHHPELDYRKIKSVGGVIPAGTDWRALADA